MIVPASAVEPIVRALLIAVVVSVSLVAAAPARAEGFVVPFYGFNFGGDSNANCQTFSGCEDKRANFGVAFGSMGPVLGFEEELSFAKDFYGTVPAGDSAVFSLMSNLVAGIGRGPVQPYAIAGAGWIRSRTSLSLVDQFERSNNSLGYDVGIGIKVYFTEHVGIRGDVRRFHTFQDVDIPVVGSSTTEVFVGQKLDFSRASFGVAFKF
jgi:opacity protein-like surface antigen